MMCSIHTLYTFFNEWNWKHLHAKRSLWHMTIVLLLLFPGFLYARFNSYMVSTSEPGEFYYVHNLFSPDNIFATYGLFYTADYGETAELVRDSVGVIVHHNASDTYWFGYEYSLYTSNDDFLTTVLVDTLRAVGYLHNATVIQDIEDSLVICSGSLSWSYDTLRTHESGRCRGITGYGIDWFQGWTGIEVYFATWQNDSVYFFNSFDYADNFTFSHWTTELDSAGHFYNGYADGELYFLSYVTGYLSVSQDSGRTWQQGALFDQRPSYGYSWEIAFKQGWAPGELICYWEEILHPWSRSPILDIYYSEDFGMTWQWMNGDQRVSDYPIKLPTTASLDVWPNPTNGQISIDLSQASLPLILYDALGRRVLDLQGVHSIDLSSLVSGTYFLSTCDGLVTKKILLVR